MKINKIDFADLSDDKIKMIHCTIELIYHDKLGKEIKKISDG